MTPDRGDILHLAFDPASGREMKGKHFCLVVSPRAFNARFKLAMVCLISGGAAEAADDPRIARVSAPCLAPPPARSTRRAPRAWQTRPITVPIAVSMRVARSRNASGEGPSIVFVSASAAGFVTVMSPVSSDRRCREVITVRAG